MSDVTHMLQRFVLIYASFFVAQLIGYWPTVIGTIFNVLWCVLEVYLTWYSLRTRVSIDRREYALQVLELKHAEEKFERALHSTGECSEQSGDRCYLKDDSDAQVEAPEPHPAPIGDYVEKEWVCDSPESLV